MRRKLSKQDKLYRSKLRQNKKLAEKALKNKFKCKPAKGLKYLEDVDIGTVISAGMSEAILLETTYTSCMVLVIDSKHDDAYYIGRHRWGPKTEVKIIH